MRICAATGNAGKLRELRRILEAQGHEVVSQKELGITIEPDETGTTFEANALIKAETICKASGLPTIADDSGLCVDALDGAPGVYSARYCGHHGDDEANNDKLLENMKDVPAGQRGAKFVAAVVVVAPSRGASGEEVKLRTLSFVQIHRKPHRKGAVCGQNAKKSVFLLPNGAKRAIL